MILATNLGDPLISGASESIHGQWSSRRVFILAVMGSAVGLGNIWRFPYVTGENGGGTCILAIANRPL